MPNCRLQEQEFKVDVSEYLGSLLFVKLQKRHLLQDDAWFCNWISVQGPGDEGAEYRFPCYRWVQGNNILSLPEGTGKYQGQVCEKAQERLGCVCVCLHVQMWKIEPGGQGLFGSCQNRKLLAQVSRRQERDTKL